MRSLNRWFGWQQARAQRAVYLEDALLGGRSAAYAYYRLRFFLGRVIVAAGLHVVEFAILSFIFSDRALVSALLVRTAGGLLHAWWWGALEVMRSEVRSLYRERKKRLIAQRVPPWFRLSLFCSTSVLVLTVGWIVLDVRRPSGEFDVFHMYVFATGFRLSLGILARTYHSVVYAVRRIYRPFLAIVGVQLTAFAGTVLVWPLLGPWSFPVMLIPTALLANALTFYYVRPVYRFLGLGPLRLSGDHKRNRGWRPPLGREFFLAGFAYASTRLDHLLVISLFYGAYRSQRGFELLLLFYLVGPFVRAAYEWAQLFYFDLMRLEPDLFETLRERFSHFVRRVALVMGLLCWMLACLFGTVLVQRNMGPLYFLLAVFFLVRSLLAFYQIRAFTEHRYRALVLTALLIFSSVFFTRALLPDENGRLGFLILASACAVVALRPKSLASLRRKTADNRLPLMDWLARLWKLKQPVRIRSLQLDHDAGSWMVDRMTQEVARAIGSFGAATLVGPHQIAWYELEASTKHPSDDWLLQRAAGLVERLRTDPNAINGAEALNYARRQGFLRCDGLEWGGKLPTIAEVKRVFLSRFPDGLLYDAGAGRPGTLGSMSSTDRHAILYGAIQYSKNCFRASRRSPSEVTTLCDRGRIRLIFGIPRTEPLHKRSAWGEDIHAINIRFATRAEPSERKVSPMFTIHLKRTLIAAAAVLVLAIIPWLVTTEERACGTFRLRSVRTARVRAPVGGVVHVVECNEGDRVSAGTPMFRMEDPELATRISRKRIELERIGAAADASETGNTSVERPAVSALPRSPAEQSRRTRLREEWAYLKKLEEALVIRCPMDGVVASPNLGDKVGQHFRKGEVICVVVEPSELEAEIMLSERQFARVRPGQPIALKPRALPFQTLHAQVERIAPIVAIDKKESTGTVSCRISNEPRLLKPGMSGYARITVGSRSLGSIWLDRLMGFLRTEFWW